MPYVADYSTLRYYCKRKPVMNISYLNICIVLIGKNLYNAILTENKGNYGNERNYI